MSITASKRRQSRVDRNASPSSRKTAFALSAVSVALCAAWTGQAMANEYSYAGDPGRVATSSTDVATAKSTWETAEYNRDWGMKAMKVSSAYALGFFGQDRTVGVMDSGALASHPEFQGDRFVYVTQQGVYGTDGRRFRGDGVNTGGSGITSDGTYTAGEKFDITGQWTQGVNDTHGTHVTGTIGANRDGDLATTNMHGIAFASTIIVGNTGATDNNNYGPYQDYNFFYTGWKAMVDAGAEVINNSWGTNIRIKNQVAIAGANNGNISAMLPARNLADAEYEYFYWKKVYGEGNKSFVDAAWDAVKGTKVVQVFTTGNRDMENPFHRALYPYFHPEAESQWIAVAGLRQSGTNYEIYSTFNEAGLAKWWTVVAPASGINSTVITNVADANGNGDDPVAGYASFSGTSMAAPHVTGAMGVLLSRYLNMDATQARDVLFTTATHKNGNSNFAGWTAPEGVPDERYGWGLPDLEKGMYGPGQFLGKLEYNASVAPLDVWSNDISQTALDARGNEDQLWLEQYELYGVSALGSYERGTSFIVDDETGDDTDHIISPADAEKWRKEYADARAAVIRDKFANGLYNGSLVKKGTGTLVMTGDNTYRGGTTVEEGALYGFAESFGTAAVVVNGGTFGILSEYNDNFTMKGTLTTKVTASSPGIANLAKVEVNQGGTLLLVAGQKVRIDSLTFNDGARMIVGAVDPSVAQNVYDNNATATGTITVTNALTDFEKANISQYYAFLDMAVTQSGDKKVLTGTLTKNAASYSDYADNRNEREIAGLLDNPNNRQGDFYDALPIPTVTRDELTQTLKSLGSDMYLNADSASVVNLMSATRAVKDQARGISAGRRESISDHARVWAIGVGTWGTVDYGQSETDVDYYTGLIGVETDFGEHHTGGLYFGAGTSKFKGGSYGLVKSTDLTFGLYGISDIADTVAVSYGVAHTRQDRDADRVLTVGSASQRNALSYNAQVTELSVEAAYTKFAVGSFAIEPYVGLSVFQLKADGFTEHVNNVTLKTASHKETLEAGQIGVRGKYPFSVGEKASFSATADLSGTYFFGDSAPATKLTLGKTGTVSLEGGKQKALFNVGLGLEAAIGEKVSVGVSYIGAYSSDVKSNGVRANLRVRF